MWAELRKLLSGLNSLTRKGIFLVLLTSCASQKPVSFLHSEYSQRRPSLIAVLPFDNMSVDLDATPLIRPIVHQRLIYKGYRGVPLEEVDRVLKDKGVMVSHDVYMFTPKELGELLGAEALVYGTVTEFNKHYAVLYSDIVVGLSLKMVDARTGETLWQEERISTENTLLDNLLLAMRYRNPEESLAAVLAYNAAFALLSQYRPYAEDAVREALLSLPAGPYGEMIYPWDLEHSVWSEDIVDPWLRRSPLILTYSPYAPTPPEKTKPETDEEHHQRKKQTSDKKEKPDISIQKVGPKRGTGIIINLNPAFKDRPKKNPDQQKSDQKSESDKKKDQAEKTSSNQSDGGKKKESADSDQSNTKKKKEKEKNQ